MFRLKTHLGAGYSPLYFLAALGAGGSVVTFFMYLMFMLPHPDTPIPVFEDLAAVFTAGPLASQIMTAVSLVGIILFGALHIRLLVWNIAEYQRFKATSAFHALRNANNEVQLMAIPLTYAMAINVGFIFGALFVPGLWSIVHYLFPAAMLGFLAVGIYGGWLFLDFLSRALVHGHFDCQRNNNLGQMLSIFAFAMVAVGLAAPAAMGNDPLVSGTAMVLSLFFVTVAVVLAVIKLVLGFRSMLEHGVNAESTATLWIVIPIVTVLGIAIFRLHMTLVHVFGAPDDPHFLFVFTTVALSIELLFGLIGWMVMRRTNYFARFVSGPERSPGSFALICPGVALFVFANFFINKGLIGIGILDKFSIAYFVLYIPLVYLQIRTLLLLLRLNSKLLRIENRTAETSSQAA